jgi:hypothetical protein
MKVRLTEAALMNMVKNAVMEVIKEEAMNEYFFANMEKKEKKSCPVVDNACYLVDPDKKSTNKKSTDKRPKKTTKKQ